MKKLVAFMMTAAMVMGLSVPVFAADYAPYTARSGVNTVLFNEAYAKTLAVDFMDDYENITTKTVTLVQAKGGYTVQFAGGNDPFVNVKRYMDAGGAYGRTGWQMLMDKGDVTDIGKFALWEFDNNVFVCMDGTSPETEGTPVTPAAPAKPAAPAAQKAKANPTDSKVLVDGKVVAFDAYNINGNNYFKLRDVAQVVSGSAKQFAVTWDGSKNSINLVSGEAYASVGTELAKGDGKAKDATLNTAAIYKDGAVADLTAYTIKGNNYFKLRDLGQAFDFNVAWDGANNCITIDTATGYVK